MGAAISSNAVTKTWIAQAADAWVGGVAPTETDRATIVSGAVIEIDGTIIVGDDTTTAAITVASGGTLHVPSTVAGNYTLTCKGDFKVAGIFNIGTVANPIPNTRIFTLKLNYSATLTDGEYGLLIQAGGTWTCQGSDPWGNGLTDPDRTLLAADAAANATAITVADTTLWAANDRIYIAPTTRTYTQYDPTGTYAGQVSSSSGTTLNLTNFGGTGGGLLYAHSGTSPNQAEIINLTRNVVIQNYDGGPGAPGNAAYVVFETTATVNIDWTEFRYLGTNSADKYGITVKTTSGSCSLNRCSIHDMEYRGINGSGAAVNASITNTVIARTAHYAINIESATTGAWTINNDWAIATGSTAFILYSCNFSTRLTLDYIRASGCAGAFNSNGSHVWGIDHSVFRSNNSGLSMTNYCRDFTIANTHVGRNYTVGIDFGNAAYGTISDTYIIANDTQNLRWHGLNTVTFTNVTVDGDASFASALGINLGWTYLGWANNVRFYNSSFGATTGHTTTDIGVYSASVTGFYAEIFLYNTTLGSSTEVAHYSFKEQSGFVRASKHDGTSGLAGEKTWVLGRGTISPDTTYYAIASPSQKLTPSSATYKLESGAKQFTIASGQVATVGVYFRKSAAYNGNQPRLMVRRNDALGITADTVLATSAAAVDVDVAPGTFTSLSGATAAVTADGVLEVFLDCDGTAGYVNADVWSVSLA